MQTQWLVQRWDQHAVLSDLILLQPWWIPDSLTSSQSRLGNWRRSQDRDWPCLGANSSERKKKCCHFCKVRRIYSTWLREVFRAVNPVFWPPGHPSSSARWRGLSAGLRLFCKRGGSLPELWQNAHCCHCSLWNPPEWTEAWQRKKLSI